MKVLVDELNSNGARLFRQGFRAPFGSIGTAVDADHAVPLDQVQALIAVALSAGGTRVDQTAVSAGGGNVLDFSAFTAPLTTNCVTINNGTNDIKSFSGANVVDGHRIILRAADGITVRVWSLNNLVLSGGVPFIDLTSDSGAVPARVDYLEFEYDSIISCYKQVGGEIYTAIG